MLLFEYLYCLFDTDFDVDIEREGKSNKIAFCFLLATGPTVKKSFFRELLGLSISISLIYFVNQGTFAVIQKEVVLFELD